MGLYVDTQEVGKEMAAFAGKPSAELTSSGSKVYGELLKDSAMTKTLRLVMVRTVTGAQMGSAISEAVEARMTDKSKQGADAFEALKQTFSMPELKTGTEITFTWTQGGNLAVKLEGKDIGMMHSVSLATALFDVFLGETVRDPLNNDPNKNLLSSRQASPVLILRVFPLVSLTSTRTFTTRIQCSLSHAVLPRCSFYSLLPSAASS